MCVIIWGDVSRAAVESNTTTLVQVCSSVVMSINRSNSRAARVLLRKVLGTIIVMVPVLPPPVSYLLWLMSI